MTTFRTSSPHKPYTHVSKPQRVADRQQMYGSRIEPANDNRSRSWLWIQFAVYAVCTVYALKIWVIG